MISQREALRLRKRVEFLEARQRDERNAWLKEYPGGVHLGSIEGDWLAGHVKLSRKLKHAVVATTDDKNYIHFYALPVAAT